MPPKKENDAQMTFPCDAAEIAYPIIVMARLRKVSKAQIIKELLYQSLRRDPEYAGLVTEGKQMTRAQHKAIQNGHFEIVDGKAVITTSNDEESLAQHKAIQNGHFEIVDGKIVVTEAENG